MSDFDDAFSSMAADALEVLGTEPFEIGGHTFTGNFNSGPQSFTVVIGGQESQLSGYTLTAAVAQFGPDLPQPQQRVKLRGRIYEILSVESDPALITLVLRDPDAAT